VRKPGSACKSAPSKDGSEFWHPTRMARKSDRLCSNVPTGAGVASLAHHQHASGQGPASEVVIKSVRLQLRSRLSRGASKEQGF